MIALIRGVAHDPIPPVIDGLRTRVRESSRFRAGFGDALPHRACSLPIAKNGTGAGTTAASATPHAKQQISFKGTSGSARPLWLLPPSFVRPPGVEFPQLPADSLLWPAVLSGGRYAGFSPFPRRASARQFRCLERTAERHTRKTQRLPTCNCGFQNSRGGSGTEESRFVHAGRTCRSSALLQVPVRDVPWRKRRWQGGSC